MPTLLSYLDTKFGRAADVDVFTKPFRPMEPLAQLRTSPLHTTRDIRRYYVRRSTQIRPQSKRSLTSRPATWVRCASGSRQDAVEGGRLVELTNREVYSSSCREVG